MPLNKSVTKYDNRIRKRCTPAGNRTHSELSSLLLVLVGLKSDTRYESNNADHFLRNGELPPAAKEVSRFDSNIPT